MIDFHLHQKEIFNQGYLIIDSIFKDNEVNEMIQIIEMKEKDNENFRHSNQLFAIRQFLKEIPEIKKVIFNENLFTLIQKIFGKNYFIIKSIYFDKPETSNWFVAYHQDLTISVDKKVNIKNFGPWTVKNNQFAVQPPLEFLENIFTIRIHLDDTNHENGALKVIPKSHHKKIYRPENINWKNENEEICSVKKGGVMLMKPLLLHSSLKTIIPKRRRVIHLEFSNLELPEVLKWAERI